MNVVFVAVSCLGAVLSAAVLPFEKGPVAGFSPKAYEGGKPPSAAFFTVNPARKGVAPDGNCYVADDFAPAKRETFTVQAFIRVKPTEAFGHVASQRRGRNGSGSSWSLSVSPQGMLMARFDLQSGKTKEGFNSIVGSNATVADGRWHHVALTVDGETHEVTLYCDYKPVRFRRFSSPLVYDGGFLVVGQGLDGELRELAFDEAVLQSDDFACAPWFVRERDALAVSAVPVAYDNTYTRVQTGVRPKGMVRAGTLIPKKTDEISTSRWSLGCECLERNLASWDAYKNYLPLLGIRKIRLQGGWFRTEKEPGKYNFGWLDRIVDEAHERGLSVCLETSYRNPLYAHKAPLGPNERGFDDWSAEEYAAWDRWVEAMVRRYSPRGVKEWMMYNEPNLGMGPLTPEGKTARWNGILENNLRTAETIKRIDPQAKVAAFVLAGLNLGPITNMLAAVKKRGKLHLFDYAVFHGYSLNPDKLIEGERKLTAWLAENAPHIRAWQGEAGCASEEVQFAMSGVPWTEYSQAKWNLRRMFCDISSNVDSLLFTVSDLAYNKNFISRYGLLKTNPDNSVIRVKMSFYAAQNLVSVFNDSLDPAPAKRPLFSALSNPEKDVGFAAFTDKSTGQDVLAIWDKTVVPDENRELVSCTVSVPEGKMENPVWVDLVNAQIWEFPEGSVTKEGGLLVIRSVPYYDGPSAIVPRALLALEKPKTYKRRVAPGMKKGKDAKAK